MKFIISSTKEENGRAAAEKAAEILRNFLVSKSKVSFVIATGASQFEFLDFLCKSEGIDWARTEMFHLDEYVGIAATHPSSFRKYLSERFVKKVHPGKVHFIEGDALDPAAECKRISNLISKEKIDIAFIGIGENGHIAFNDPPADFETEEPYLLLNLDEQCRKQQVGEGWFTSIEKVPQKAISMSVRQIIKAEYIICTCPDKRKAEAVRDCLSIDAPITPMHPASILKKHDKSFIFLDKESASLLTK
ncbi:MAG: glucosamine-6-phosphate deaminase [Candidatus Helarchaeota archaeon]|nr:glucosamine-6-phosphate deaminase [Candidatus Helarchaeota archaeon]